MPSAISQFLGDDLVSELLVVLQVRFHILNGLENLKFKNQFIQTGYYSKEMTFNRQNPG